MLRCPNQSVMVVSATAAGPRRVQGKCVKKTPTIQNAAPQEEAPRKRSLAQLGYKKIKDKSVAQRRKALRDAVLEHGKPQVLTWLRRLLTFNKSKREYKTIYEEDIAYVQRYNVPASASAAASSASSRGGGGGGPITRNRRPPPSQRRQGPASNTRSNNNNNPAQPPPRRATQINLKRGASAAASSSSAVAPKRRRK